MSDRHEITIKTNPKYTPLRALGSFVYTAGIIGLGVYLDSAAMQWVGFLIVVLTGMALVGKEVDKNKGLTIDQARERLDEIERGEASQ